MKTNEVHTFILAHSQSIYKTALANVKSCLWFFHNRQADHIIDARSAEDIVQQVLMKVWSEPFELGSELTIGTFNKEVAKLIRNEVAERNRRHKLAKPRPDKGYGELSADQFFDQMLSDERENEVQSEYEARLTKFLKKIEELIDFYDSNSSDPANLENWFVLTEWLKGKSMAEIAVDGDMTLRQVENCRKRIRLAIRKGF